MNYQANRFLHLRWHHHNDNVLRQQFYKAGAALVDELSLTKISGSDDALADVIFIHGLTGDPQKTWRLRGGKGTWLPWLSQDFLALRVFTLGYPAGLFKKWAKQEMDTSERAKNALEHMAARGFGDRPIIFIVHSLGGILLKAILRAASDSTDERWIKIMNAARMAIFLSTPHKGAALAEILRTVSTAPAIDILANTSGHLNNLNDFFKGHVQKHQDLSISVYYEKHKTLNAALVVTPDSADPGITDVNPIPVDRDHNTICQPENQDDFVYCSIKSKIKVFLDKNTPKPEAQQGCAATFGPDDYSQKTDSDRRTLLDKLDAANRLHEYSKANEYQNRFARNYTRLGLFTEERETSDKLLSDIEQLFTTHVYHDQICKSASHDQIQTALQEKVIEPTMALHANIRGLTRTGILSAVYFLTEQCHLRWDPEATL